MNKFDWWTMNKWQIIRTLDNILENEKIREERLRVMLLQSDVANKILTRDQLIIKVVQTFQQNEDMEHILELAKSRREYKDTTLGEIILTQII